VAFDKGRAEYEYSYTQSSIAGCLDSPFCCFESQECTKKRKAKRHLHHKNLARLESEKDIANIVQHIRVSKFIQGTQFTPAQRYFVTKFRKYHLDDDADENEVQLHRIEKEANLTKSGYSNF
jgi:hypothetical protein